VLLWEKQLKNPAQPFLTPIVMGKQSILLLLRREKVKCHIPISVQVPQLTLQIFIEKLGKPQVL